MLAVVRAGQLFGASVCDSGVWVLTSETIFDLTEKQRRKPLLGSGQADPVGFGPLYFNDRVVVASDGLLKYATRDTFMAVGLRRSPDLSVEADALIDGARLPSGDLHDDLALVLLEPELPEAVS